MIPTLYSFFLFLFFLFLLSSSLFSRLHFSVLHLLSFPSLLFSLYSFLSPSISSLHSLLSFIPLSLHFPSFFTSPTSFPSLVLSRFSQYYIILFPPLPSSFPIPFPPLPSSFPFLLLPSFFLSLFLSILPFPSLPLPFPLYFSPPSSFPSFAFFSSPFIIPLSVFICQSTSFSPFLFFKLVLPGSFSFPSSSGSSFYAFSNSFPPLSSIPLLLLLFPLLPLSNERFQSVFLFTVLSFYCLAKKKKIYQNLRKGESKTNIPFILLCMWEWEWKWKWEWEK